MGVSMYEGLNTSAWSNNSACPGDLVKLIIVPSENVPNNKCAYSEVLNLRRPKMD